YPEIGQRLIGCAEAQGIAQPVSRCRRCRRVCTAREIRDGLVEEITCEHYRHGVGVLEIEYARRAVGERARGGYAGGIAAVTLEPLDRTRDIGERDAILRVGVELGPVTDDQPFIRADSCRGRQHRDVKLAVWRSAVAQRVVAARVERALARDRGDAVCG